MKFQFETSLGICYGNSDEYGYAKIDDGSIELLSKLYNISYCFKHKIENKWLKIRLAKDTENYPEYKVVYID